MVQQSRIGHSHMALSSTANKFSIAEHLPDAGQRGLRQPNTLLLQGASQPHAALWLSSEARQACAGACQLAHVHTARGHSRRTGLHFAGAGDGLAAIGDLDSAKRTDHDQTDGGGSKTHLHQRYAPYAASLTPHQSYERMVHQMLACISAHFMPGTDMSTSHVDRVVVCVVPVLSSFFVEGRRSKKILHVSRVCMHALLGKKWKVAHSIFRHRVQSMKLTLPASENCLPKASSLPPKRILPAGIVFLEQMIRL